MTKMFKVSLKSSLETHKLINLLTYQRFYEKVNFRINILKMINFDV